MSVFGSDCVMVIFNLIICFPSLPRHSQTGSQADKFCQYLLGVSAINSVISSQRLYNLSPPLQHSLLPLGNIPQYLSRWERIKYQLPTCRYNILHGRPSRRWENNIKDGSSGSGLWGYGLDRAGSG